MYGVYSASDKGHQQQTVENVQTKMSKFLQNVTLLAQHLNQSALRPQKNQASPFMSWRSAVSGAGLWNLQPPYSCEIIVVYLCTTSQRVRIKPDRNLTCCTVWPPPVKSCEWLIRWAHWRVMQLHTNSLAKLDFYTRLKKAPGKPKACCKSGVKAGKTQDGFWQRASNYNQERPVD